ncbi:MAG: hypothetical protein QM679_04900 [Patulibacter sp.]
MSNLDLEVAPLESLEAPSFWEGFKLGFPAGVGIGIAIFVAT